MFLCKEAEQTLGWRDPKTAGQGGLVCVMAHIPGPALMGGETILVGKQHSFFRARSN